MVISEILLIFWAAYFTLIFITNLLDAFKKLNVLPASWKFESGNYKYIQNTTSIFSLPGWTTGFLFFCVILMEGIIAFTFWSSLFSENIYLPFSLGIILFGGFVIMDEIFISYVPEATHYRIFIALIASLIFLEIFFHKAL